MEKFDAIIIGSGQAGNPLAKRLSQEGIFMSDGGCHKHEFWHAEGLD